MADFLTPEQRSHRMSLIRSSGTKPERLVASLLRQSRIRFRRHAKLPGTPDFVLVESNVAVFADGDFWHGRSFEESKAKLSPFWKDKITRNRARDRRVDKALRRLGYSVVRLWETDVYRKPQRCVDRIWKAHLTKSEAGL